MSVPTPIIVVSVLTRIVLVEYASVRINNFARTWWMVLTRKNMGGKLERVKLHQQGQGPCRKTRVPLRENLRWKPYNLQNPVRSQWHRLHVIWVLQTVLFTIGVSCFPCKESRHFLEVGIKHHKRRKFAGACRENEILRQ